MLSYVPFLALPLFVCQEPDRPAGVKAVIKGKEYLWTVWDRIDISEPSMTLAQLIAYLMSEYGVELSMLSSGVTILFSDFMDRKKSAEYWHGRNFSGDSPARQLPTNGEARNAQANEGQAE